MSETKQVIIQPVCGSCRKPIDAYPLRVLLLQEVRSALGMWRAMHDPEHTKPDPWDEVRKRFLQEAAP